VPSVPRPDNHAGRVGVGAGVDAVRNPSHWIHLIFSVPSYSRPSFSGELFGSCLCDWLHKCEPSLRRLSSTGLGVTPSYTPKGHPHSHLPGLRKRRSNWSKKATRCSRSHLNRKLRLSPRCLYHWSSVSVYVRAVRRCVHSICGIGPIWGGCGSLVSLCLTWERMPHDCMHGSAHLHCFA
jgi:hypothetical protein